MKDPAGNLRCRAAFGPTTGPNQTRNIGHGTHKPSHKDSDRFWTVFWVFRPRSETTTLREAERDLTSRCWTVFQLRHSSASKTLTSHIHGTLFQTLATLAMLAMVFKLRDGSAAKTLTSPLNRRIPTSDRSNFNLAWGLGPWMGPWMSPNPMNL